MTTQTVPGPRRRVPRAERERQIVDAAVAVFGEHGYSGASMDTVAERVGVTKPVLYAHFRSKEALLLAAITRARAELLEVTARAAGEADDPESMLRGGTLAFFTYLDRRAPAWQLFCSEAGVTGEALEEIRAQQTDFIAGLLAAQVPGTEPDRLTGWAQVIVGAAERLAVWRGQDERITAAQATDYLMEVAWTGLAGLPRAR
ncbi:TetR/AcrR family transcriptional regulator [Pseudonocardia sp. HH130630-07]|uniref:TetR/AcrR family transcriptional regulator n=1 Tax=Pseudonocardia sp. HH130630-07 TaxID=1690815 RepID=UPI00081538E0|nr:TetR/AcrR family transcriptional regulator [Pseudonocardia sp. HH130630-07]ANY08083.1 transcriptional regulator [Pseudonocardia sp. HH130630-07]